MSRAEALKLMSPQIIADVTLYSQAEGGRSQAALPGWGCPCSVVDVQPTIFYGGWPLLGDTPIGPGETRRLGWVFPFADEGADIMKRAGRFYLWEGRFIGEANVVEERSG